MSSRTNPKVAVLMGGPSAEREVSLSSGRACAAALREQNYQVVEVDAGRDLCAVLGSENPDVVFNALHGRWCEDGCVQGILEWLGLPGEEIPLDDNSADTVVLTYTLCTIPDWLAAVKQMRRVLKPGGKLLFSEHGKAPDEAVQRWQDRINPAWKKMAGGCHLNRDIPQLLEQGGFTIRKMESLYLPSTPKFAGFTYWGHAN